MHRGGSDPEHASEVRLCDLTLAQVRSERRRPASTFELGHASRLQFSESRGKRIAVNSESRPNYAVDMSGYTIGGHAVTRTGPAVSTIVGQTYGVFGIILNFTTRA